MDEEKRWELGVALAVLSALFTNVGINMQKLAHRLLVKRIDLGPKEQGLCYCQSYVWLAGIGVMIIGAISDFVALGLAPQTIVAPVGALTLVSNMFVARWMHGEIISASGMMATFLILSGVVLSVVFAPRKTRLIGFDFLEDCHF